MRPSPCPTPEELLHEVWHFPLLEAVFGRRSRRFGLGMEIPDGPLAFRSRHPPLPLSELERTLLIAAATGVSGWHFGIPYTPAESPGGCSYSLRYTGRPFPSGAGIHPSELFFTDDSGVYMTRLRDALPHRLREVATVADIEPVLTRCRQALVRLHDARLALPRQAPHISEHNLWNANVPGSVLFFPMANLSEYCLARLCIRVVNGYYLYDNLAGRPCGDLEPFIRSGLLQEPRRVWLSSFEQDALSHAAIELGTMGQTLVLVLQAMGLGGWLFTGIHPPSAMGAFAAQGIRGLGFRFAHRNDWPAPNPVGLDGHFEGYCPPYFPDMRAAARQFVRHKFGPGGTYDPHTPGPFLRSGEVKSLVKPYAEEFIACLGEMAQYVYDTYGKFPATIPTIFMRVCIQAHHLDAEFYDRHFRKGAYLETHAQHLARWHPRVEEDR